MWAAIHMKTLNTLWAIWEDNYLYIKPLFDVLGTVGTIVLGLLAVKAWFRQLRGSTRYNIAARLKVAAYKFKDCIRLPRGSLSPLVCLTEEEVRIISQSSYARIATSLEAEIAYLSSQIVSAEKYYQEYKDVIHETVAFISPNIEKYRGPLTDVYNKWISSLQNRLIISHSALRTGNCDNLIYVDPILVPGDTTVDAFGKELNDAIKEIERFANKYRNG
jgi:hypothetical protein